MAVKVHKVTAVHDGTWWVVDVPDYGATQAKRLSQVPRMARMLIADLDDVDPASVEIEVDARVPRLSEQMRRIDRAQRAAQEALRKEAAARRQLVRELRDRGLSQHDIAAVVGVSRPAVQKLLRDKVSA